MIPLVSILLLISYLVQGTVSNYVGYSYANLTWFSCLYILSAILVVKPYFENEVKYIVMVIIVGFVMGITYTNAALFNVCLFILAYYSAKLFHFFFPYNFVTINISALIGVFVYHIVSFLFLLVLNYDAYPVEMLLRILARSIPMTILYTSFLYWAVEQIIHKFSLREIK